MAEDGVKRFLNSDKTLQLIHTDFNGNSQIVHYLTAMGEEELLLAAKEELEK